MYNPTSFFSSLRPVLLFPIICPRNTKEIYELRLDRPRFRLRLPRMSLLDFPLLFLLLFSAQRMFPTVCDWALRFFPLFFPSFSYPPKTYYLPLYSSSSTPLSQSSSDFIPSFLCGYFLYYCQMLEFIPWVLSPEPMYQKIRTGHNSPLGRYHYLPNISISIFSFQFSFPFTLFAIDLILHDECFFFFVIRFR